MTLHAKAKEIAWDIGYEIWILDEICEGLQL